MFKKYESCKKVAIFFSDNKVNDKNNIINSIVYFSFEIQNDPFWFWRNCMWKWAFRSKQQHNLKISGYNLHYIMKVHSSIGIVNTKLV